MSTSTMLDNLAIPPQKEPDRASFDARPKLIEEWIRLLPMANLGETSRMVFKAVVEINRLQLPVQDRYKSLEALREPCQYITQSLEKHFAGRPLPLNEKNRKISELARALASEQALGYKIIARQLASSEKRTDRSLLLSALHRSSNYLGILLLRSYQVYAPYPRNVWKELHTIYKYAEETELLDLPLKDDMGHLPGSHCTIGMMYKKVLMLALAMPYRLHRGEVDKVCSLLNKLVHMVSLEKTITQENHQDLFIANLDEDKQPGYLSLYQGTNFDECRLLNTGKLVRHMQESINEADTELTSLASIDLLRRLLTSWSIMSKRSFSRIPKQEAHVEVAFGISAAHHYISGEKSFDSDKKESDSLSLQTNNVSEFHSGKVNAISDHFSGPDIWTSNYTYSANDPINAEPNNSSLNSKASGIQSFDYRTIRLAMKNVSAGGYCLISTDSSNLSAHVGDLLAIREYNDKSIDQWGIGVTRRMMNLGNGNIELGVQMLTPNAVAVAARLEGYNGDGHKSEFMRCLMLPELRAIDQPATIITPALPFKQDSHIRINLQDKQILAALTRQLEHTRSFSQFEFSVLNEDIPAPETDNNKTGTNELDFDSLWTTL